MIPELVGSLDRSLAFLRGQVADLPDEEIALQPPGAPNHPAWTLGHVIHSWQAIAAELGVRPWLPGEWESCYGYGSLPGAPSAPQVPTKEALLAMLADAGARLRCALLTTDESRLSRPLAEAAAREIFPTVGDALLQVVSAHTAFHAGQLAAWRRAIGRPPSGAFI